MKRLSSALGEELSLGSTTCKKKTGWMQKNVLFAGTLCLAESCRLLQYRPGRSNEVWDRKQAKQTLPTLANAKQLVRGKL